jgi:cytochrome P450
LAADRAVRAAPGPRGATLLRVLVALTRDPLGGLVRITRDYGDVVHLPLGHRRFHLVAHPDDVARVLHENHRNYGKGTRSYDKVRTLMGDGLVTSEGEAWRRQRRLVQPAFHHRQVAGFATAITDLTAEMLAGWRARAEGAEPLDVAAEMTRLTLRIVGHTLFGEELGDGHRPLGEAVAVALGHTARRAEAVLDLGDLPTPGRRRFRRAVAQLDALVFRLIEERRGGRTDGHDLLSLLLAARDEETGSGLGDTELRDQVLTLLLAGHETTATALTWTSYLLARHPPMQERLRHEVVEVLGERAPTHDDLGALPYLRMVLQESMRLFPPIWLIERRAQGEDVLGGCAIPAGTTLALSQYVTHRHPRFWDEPERFDPDRFLPERVAARPRGSYFPFGGGPRACIGAGFAMMEAQLILAMLVRHFRLDPVAGQRVACLPGITLRPRGPVWIRPTHLHRAARR